MQNRLLIVLAIVCVGATGYFAGLFRYFDPDDLRELIISWGAAGPLLVVLAFSLVQPFGFPGMIFMMASSTLWPFWGAFFVNWAGATGAGMVGFGFARYLGRDWVEDRMPERVRVWDERLSKRGLPVVIPFRLIFFLSPPAHWALGLSRVRLSHAIVGTAIGFVPGVAAWTYFGGEILIWLERQSSRTYFAVIAAVIVFVVIRRILSRRSPKLSR